MNDARKQEIINDLQAIVNGFTPTDSQPEITMFWLVSQYNQKYNNIELIGGNWINENTPNLLN